MAGGGTGPAGVAVRGGTIAIIVTKQSVIAHKNPKLGIELTPRTRRFVQVGRDGCRVQISAGAAAESSFVPPEDPAGGANDIRAVVKGGDDESEVSSLA